MDITIVVPIYNEVDIIKDKTQKLYSFCSENLNQHHWQIVLADNASTDGSSKICQSLAEQKPDIEYEFIQAKGKGLAIITAWQKYNPQIGLFIDADLAPQLDVIPKMIAAIAAGSDMAIGSRNLPESVLKRPLMRQIVSYFNNKLLRIIFKVSVKDTACGVKAVNQNIIQEILPKIKNQAWFFDTEMIVLAELNGYKISELPVTWRDRDNDDGQSKINVLKVSWQYLREMLRLKLSLLN